MGEKDIENVLRVQSIGYFDDERIQKRVYELGKMHYFSMVENYLKNYSKRVSEDYAIVDTIIYVTKIKKLKDKNKGDERGLENFLNNIIALFN